MKSLTTCFLMILLVLPTALSTAAPFDWPQWQGKDRNGISHETGLLQEWPADGPPLAWKVEGLGGGDSTPSVADGRIFGMSHRGEDEIVWALDEKDGSELWASRLGPARQQGMRQSQEGPGATPTVDGKRLYVLGLNGDVACLQVENGKIVWSRSLTKDFGGVVPTWSYRESVLIDGNKVIVTPGGTNATIVALNKQTGDTIWVNAPAKSNANAQAGRSSNRIDATVQYQAKDKALDRLASFTTQNVFGQPQAPAQDRATAPLKKPVVLIPSASTWKYLDKGVYPGSDWTAIKFDDAAWSEGAAQLGYGDGDEKTKLNDSRENYPTYYFRQRFEVKDPKQLKPLILRLKKDDGAVVYINGREVWRDNMEAGPIKHDSFARGTAFEEDEFNLHDVASDQLIKGINVVAVEVHQASATSSDVSFELEFREKIPGVDVVRSASERTRARSRSGRRRGGSGGGRTQSGAGYSSSIAIDFDGQRQYVQLTATSLIGVSAADGKLLWSYDAPANSRRINCSTPLYYDGHIVAASAYGNGGGMAKLSKDASGKITANEVWFSKNLENHHGGVVLVDGALYGANGGNGGGYLVCLDFKTGEILWDEGDRDKRRVRKGSVAVADNRIYYRTEQGTLVLIEPNKKEYIEHGRFEQPDRSSKPAWAHPIVANGKLYVRDQGVLFCYNVKK